MAEPSDFIDLAHRLADAARAETLPRWQDGVLADNKASQGWDPVTEADREAERAMRALSELTWCIPVSASGICASLP